MSEKTIVSKRKLTNIADKIRSKLNISDTLSLDEMADKIDEIQSVSNLNQLEAATLSYTTGNTYFNISYPSNNGKFDTGIIIYQDDEQVLVQNSLPSSYNFNIKTDVISSYKVQLTGNAMKTSVDSNTISVHFVSLTNTLADGIKSSNSATKVYYDNQYTTTYSSTEESVYLPTDITIKMEDKEISSDDYTYDVYTGKLTIPNVKNKVEITLGSDTKPILSVPTLSKHGLVATWSSVENATSYDLYLSYGSTTSVVYSGSDLSCDLTEYVKEENMYTIYVIAKADGYRNSVPNNKIKFYYNPSFEADPVFANNDWTTIAKGFALGLADTIGWQLGDEKDLVVNGTTYPIRIVDMTEGRYSSSDGAANHAVLMFKNLYNASYRMNSSAITTNGWKGSEMRLTNIKNIWNGIADEEFKTSVMNVLVGSASYGGSGKSATTNGGVILYSDGDQIFLPTQSELFGSNATYEYTTVINAYPQFALYKNNDTSTFRRMHKQSSTSNEWYWTRSPSYNYSNDFAGVYSNGYANSDYANLSSGVAPCFAM